METVRNERFLEKAESLKRDLRSTEYEIASGRMLTAGESEVFDLGRHCVGYPEIEISSSGHHQDAPLYIKLQFAEIAAELGYDTEKYDGWISKSWIQEERIHIDILPATVKLSRRYAFRYLKITVISASENYFAVIEKVKVRAVSAENRTSVTSDFDREEDRRLDEISVNTLHSCMQDVFEDGPKRDRRLWLGDLRLQALVNYVTFKNYDLVKRCLYLFAGSTLEGGMLASNVFTEPEVECDYQSMFDYTLLFINTLWDYYEETGDRETLLDLEPVCIRQFELLRDCFDGNGLLDTEKTGRIFVDWNFDLDKQASGHAIYIYAMKALLKIEKALGKDASFIDKEIEQKTEAARTLFDPERGMFVSGPSGQVSVASQMWMILAGTVSSKEGAEILEKALKDSGVVGLNSPYAYHYLIDALIQCGVKEKAYTMMHSYWDGMVNEGTDTFWELYNPEDASYSPYGGLVVHSFCHAWSCTPSYFLRKYFN